MREAGIFATTDESTRWSSYRMFYEPRGLPAISQRNYLTLKLHVFCLTSHYRDVRHYTLLKKNEK